MTFGLVVLSQPKAGARKSHDVLSRREKVGARIRRSQDFSSTTKNLSSGFEPPTAIGE